jgi:hypothetical protein
MTTETTTIQIDLGFIGHNAEKLQELFKGYSPTPNKYGKFLRFENYTYVLNEGVFAETNSFEDEKHFNDMLMIKLLVHYLDL